ncbi:integrase [Salinibacter ruber]|uniref:Integrase n=1 Tax=Salinibacter ruber TaxID=146919 RepID=A0A9X2TF81_9BACT|nr:site-specific integrase [Salinibacter ruber]MCS3676231.1 integrase [Salinibacter ruber]MCS3679518.1 integrase [Salinibacter ruber]MCS4178475.1 integrase [Salinibacter ruber]
MASLRKHKGRYSARFYDSNRSPKRKEVALGTSRKSVAEPKLRRLEEAYGRGDYDPWNGGWVLENETVEDAIGQFLDSKRRDGLQESTLDGYEYKLNNFARHTPVGAMMRDVQPDHVHSYVHARVNEGQSNESTPSNATKRSRHRHVKAFFSWAEENELVDESPVEEVPKPRKEEKEKAFLKPEDVEKLLRTIDAHRKMKEDEPGPTPRDTWLKQMVRVAVGTGLRRGELLNLRWGDIDLDSGRLVVRNRDNFTAKNGNERTVPLRGDALDTVREMHEARTPLDNEPVFVDANDDVPKPDRVSKRFKFYVRKAKLSDREELSFHSCRHTTGSWLSMQGVPLRIISEILGHSNTQVTEMYSHLSPEAMNQAMEETFD